MDGPLPLRMKFPLSVRLPLKPAEAAYFLRPDCEYTPATATLCKWFWQVAGQGLSVVPSSNLRTFSLGTFSIV